MAKRKGFAISVIAFLVAFTSLGLQIYNTYILPQQSVSGGEIGDTWYASREDYFRTDPINTDMVLPNINLSFEVKAGQSVYFMYSATAFLDLNYDGFTELRIYFSIDGNKVESPYRWERFYYKNSEIGGISMLRSISLQHVNSTLTPGFHNVTIILKGNFDFNGVSDSSLLVQTFTT